MKWISKNDHTFLIAGPCSAESEEQLDTTVKALSELTNVDLIRAGIWKPRTKPNSFEGMGKVALPWLVNAGKKYNLPVGTEVANAQHVDEALEAGVDVLWIGARTTVNPFAVQEIADSLRGVDIPIMIKNPVNPDLQLWIGSLERIAQAGLTKIAAIHRGFSFYGDSIYRNLPQWEIPIEFMRLMPEIPLICDPSHISGRRDGIAHVSQRALDLNFNGLMIETHPDPDNAMSDAKQQVTPSSLQGIMDGLRVRESSTTDPNFHQKLEELRNQIDALDADILSKLMNRLALSNDIGQYKLEHKVSILNLERWDRIMKDRTKLGSELGLRPEFIEKIMQMIHKESIKIQNQVMNRSLLDESIDD